MKQEHDQQLAVSISVVILWIYHYRLGQVLLYQQHLDKHNVLYHNLEWGCIMQILQGYQIKGELTFTHITDNIAIGVILPIIINNQSIATPHTLMHQLHGIPRTSGVPILVINPHSNYPNKWWQPPYKQLSYSLVVDIILTYKLEVEIYKSEMVEIIRWSVLIIIFKQKINI